jgi:two-component system, OmpR family, sensor histidine kinase BaeS
VQTLRGRLILSHTLPMLLVVPLVAVALLYLLETQLLLTGLSHDLQQRARLAAEAIRQEPAVWQDPGQAQALIARLSLMTDGRLALFRPDGSPLTGSSPAGGAEAASSPAGGAPGLSEADLAATVTQESRVVARYGLFELGAEAYVPVRDFDNQLVGIVALSQTLEGAASTFGRLRWLIVGVMAAELVLGCVLAVVLAVRLARPLKRAADAVVDIAGNKPIEPLPVEGVAEIRQLAASVTLLDERLRGLEDMRRRSLANIVHELGRPLGALAAAAHVLRGPPGDDPAVRQELLAGMEGQIERMQPLLDDLALLHGQVTGHVELVCRPVSVGDWLPPLLLPWRAAALERGLLWEADVPPHLPTVSLDPRRMAQAVGNLLSNAVKYTPSGGAVAVAAGCDPQTLWIHVRDTGPGIAAEEQDRVFNAFYRSERDRRFPQGLGLGLTIARDLVVAHGGRLELESPPGGGCCFTIRLPIHPSPA